VVLLATELVGSHHKVGCNLLMQSYWLWRRRLLTTAAKWMLGMCS
jgi:hypothetical protein